MLCCMFSTLTLIPLSVADITGVGSGGGFVGLVTGNIEY